MRGLNSSTVDLVYLDPPFNSNRNFSAPVGSKAAGAAFKDMWTLSDIDEREHGELADRSPKTYEVIRAARSVAGKGMQSYLIFMAVRLLEMRRVLKNSGSIYLHCDDTAGAYLKLLMDAVFGRKNYMNEIIWGYNKGGRRKDGFKRSHDVIHFYGISSATAFVPLRVADSNGEFKLRKGFRKKNGEWWVPTKPGKECLSWWGDIPSRGTNTQGKEWTGYPTQKPLALLERIIKASSNEGDMVFDPFCGCATTLVAAHILGRNWIGCDLSPLAVKLVNQRILEFDPLFAKMINPDEPPNRSDVTGVKHYSKNKRRIFGLQEGRCNGCDEKFPYQFMEVDHILPKSKGGTDAFQNLQVLCSHCHKSKGK